MFRFTHLSSNLAALALVLSGPACSTSTPGDASEGLPPERDLGSSPAVVATPQDAGQAQGNDSETRATEAIELIRAGAYRAARDLLGELLLEQELQLAESWLDQDSPEDALVAVDRALALNAKNNAAIRLKARASLALAEKAAAGGGPGSLVIGAYEDALTYYRRAGSDAAARLGASRAALGLQRYPEALALAQEAVAELDEAGLEPVIADGTGQPEEAGAGETDRPVLTLLPERVLAEAAFRAFVEAKQTEPDAPRTQELFRTTEDALDRLLGRDRGPWTWKTLVDLYLWQGDLVAARSQAENGLDHDPNDPELIDRLANVAHQIGGPAEMAATFAAFNTRHGNSPRGLWYEAQGLFDQATDLVMPLVAAAITGSGEELPADADQAPTLFAQAEEVFRRCRESSAEYESACLGYEALTFDGRGWYLFATGDYPAAIEAFLATEKVYEGGMFAELEGRLLSAVQGIAQIGGAYNELEDWRRAGEAFALIAKVDRSRSTWANNQGFFYRDAAVELETIGRRLCSAAAEGRRDEDLLRALAERSSTDLVGVEVANNAELMRRAANAAMAEARDLMQLSWEGYQLAAELAPNDVRIVNDAGLVLVYYLHTNLDLAEELLKRAAAMGEEQMQQADELDETQRFELANAYGDAYQNLGVLYANHRDDPKAAQAYFERSVEIGPEPRPLITNFWIPFLRGELEAESVPDELRLKTWAAPCGE